MCNCRSRRKKHTLFSEAYVNDLNMRKLKVIYLGNFGNTGSDRTEEHIKYAFEQLGHEVIVINEKEFFTEKSKEGTLTSPDVKILNIKNPDLFLFHKGGVGSVINLDYLIKLLNYITCKKVCWYFDKVFPDREEYMDTVADYADYVFLTDDSFVRQHRYKNLFCLRQGIGNENLKPGEYRKKYDYDVVFTGNVYGVRVEFVQLLEQIYGNRFKVFNDVFNRDLYDLCASAKVIVSPEYPEDNFYWSSRIYMTLGSAGFLVHPDLYGLKEEFTEGKHFAGYKGTREMLKTIDYYLKNDFERENIRKMGYNRCIEKFTYKHRVQQMLEKIYGTK